MSPWFSAALLDWAVIALAMIDATLFPDWPIVAVAIIVIGNRQHALSVLGHDGSHGLITRRRWLNDLLAELLCWWPLGIGIDGHRAFHFAHHRFLGTRDDPELWHKAHFRLRYWPPISFGEKVWFFIGDLIGVTSIPEVMLAALMLWQEASRRDVIGAAAFWLAVGALAWHFGLLWLIAVWFTAAFTSQWAFGRLRIWREHVGTAGTLDVAVQWWSWGIHLPHNVGHHREHHATPWRPFYELGRT
jgi:fatty acid desaturase